MRFLLLSVVVAIPITAPAYGETFRDKAFRHRLPEAEIFRRALEDLLPKLSLTLAILGAGLCS